MAETIRIAEALGAAPNADGSEVGISLRLADGSHALLVLTPGKAHDLGITALAACQAAKAARGDPPERKFVVHATGSYAGRGGVAEQDVLFTVQFGRAAEITFRLSPDLAGASSQALQSAAQGYTYPPAMGPKH